MARSVAVTAEKNLCFRGWRASRTPRSPPAPPTRLFFSAAARIMSARFSPIAKGKKSADIEVFTMRKRLSCFIAHTLPVAIALLTASPAFAQVRANPTLEAAAAGFDVRRDSVARGRVERIEFDSTVTGNKRPAMVYTPPGYS